MKIPLSFFYPSCARFPSTCVVPTGNLIESIKVLVKVSFSSLWVGADWTPRDASAPAVSRRAPAHYPIGDEEKILSFFFVLRRHFLFHGATRGNVPGTAAQMADAHGIEFFNVGLGANRTHFHILNG